jgi:hypothetical protein
MPKNSSEETERLKRHWEREAPTYDRRMRYFARVLFGDGREWVCSRAHDEVLEVAVGTGRNFPFYRPCTKITSDRKKWWFVQTRTTISGVRTRLLVQGPF